MQRDLNRLQKRKRLIYRALGLLMLTLIAAVVVVSMRSCSEQFNEPYNKDYRPMDTQRNSLEQLP